MTDLEYEIQNARQLVGGTVMGVLEEPAGEFFGLQVRVHGRTLNAWVDCDPEGNGPGHLNIEDPQQRP